MTAPDKLTIKETEDFAETFSSLEKESNSSILAIIDRNMDGNPIIITASYLTLQLAATLRDNARLRTALQCLVDLKASKDKGGKDAHYEEMRPIAWEAAREALSYKHSDHFRDVTEKADLPTKTSETEQEKNGRLRAEIDAVPLNPHPSERSEKL